MNDLKITQAIGGKTMRLIDEDKLIEESESGCWDIDLKELQMILKYVPTIDAVPAVRCGECEYGRPDDNAFEFDGITPLIRCSYMTEPNRPHEYCSWGRRKERNIILKINYEINAKDQTTDCQFDFSAFNYPIIITNIGNCNK